jgi:hypothetical protein
MIIQNFGGESNGSKEKGSSKEEEAVSMLHISIFKFLFSSDLLSPTTNH